jgi:competence protein ComEC
MVSHYGLLANLLAVPVMGAVVMPAAVLALLLTPLGLGWIGWAVMGQGLGWILRVAEFVSGLEGARGQVIAPGPMVLPLVAFGGLILILWKGRLRWGGGLPLLAAILLWQAAERPRVLIADTGGLVGVLTPEGRALSKPKGAGFIAGIWLENDGDPALQGEAAARWPGEVSNLQSAQVAGAELIHVIGKRAAENYRTCKAGQIAVFTVPKDLEGECLVLDPVALRKTGAVLLSGEGRLVTVKDRAGARPWTGEGPQLLPLTRRILGRQ